MNINLKGDNRQTWESDVHIRLLKKTPQYCKYHRNRDRLWDLEKNELWLERQGELHGRRDIFEVGFE